MEDEEMFERMDRFAKVTPKAVVKSDYKKNIFEPEIMVCGANWSVGPSQTTYKEANSIAETAALHVLTLMEEFVHDYVASEYKKAKP